MERLRDGDASFGISQAEYARRHARKRREVARQRRQRHIEAMKSPQIEPVESKSYQIFRTSNGHAAYRRRIQRTWYTGIADYRFEVSDISLPYVSILAGRSALDPREAR